MEKLKNIDTVIFDLDGTLLYTLEDMADSVNHVMAEYGFSQHSVSAIRSFIGNGIRKLLERALPEGSSAELCDEATEKYRAHYQNHCMIKTQPYEGIMEMLERLADAGIKMAIVTNKNDEASQEMQKHFFSETIHVCYGQRNDIPKKPDRAMIDLALEKLGSLSENSVYVGDSEVDMQTAENAGMPCITCSWGYRDREYLVEKGATILVDNPSEIAKIILK